MSKWFVSTPIADFLIEAEEGVISTAPRLLADLCGLTTEKAKEICASRGWSFWAA